MKSYAEALQIILESINQLEKVSLPIENSVSSVLADDIVSGLDVAPYRNSAMDGFAIAFVDIHSSEQKFPIINITYAGDSDIVTYKKGTALKIMTGAAVPDGYDTVVKVEDTTFNEREVTFNQSIKQFQNVRMPGEDIKKDEVVFKAGEVIKSLHPGLLASIGLNEVAVIRKPSVLILSTGNELVEPADSLKFGQLYNSNSYSLRSMLAPFCSSITVDSIILDKPEQVAQALSQDYDVIITSGGVSAGDKDFIPLMAKQSHWVEKLHKIAIKPGKPLFFAQKNKQYLFGLPGNPLSTVVTAACFVIPSLKKMIGLKNYLPKKVTASLAKDSVMKSGRTLIWPGQIYDEGGKLTAKFSPKKSSAALSAVLKSDGLIFQQTTDGNPITIEVIKWSQILNL